MPIWPSRAGRTRRPRGPDSLGTPPEATVIALLLAHSLLAASPVHHDLDVRLDPASHRVAVRDLLAVEGAVPLDAEGGYRFVLHAALEPRVRSRGWRLERAEDGVGAPASTAAAGQAEAVPVRAWRLVPGPRAGDLVRLTWGGEIHHPVVTSETDYARGFAETPGLVSEEGVFLTGSTRWVPTFGDALVSYDLAVRLPAGWDVVSQGRRAEEPGRHGGPVVRWTDAGPAEEVVLVAGPWTATWSEAGDTRIGTLLRSDDPALSWRYLDATRRYLAMYEAILPPYPFPSFVTAENSWETGYGFPGFTLLGPKVIRFPWVLATSFPHEILHDWWGNGVFVATEGGNWCEGLTAYMADHLLAEQRGEAVAYRRTTLQRYADFVARAGRDLPLSAFTGRTSAATEAVGYGKSLMLFHMLRRGLGDEAFLGTLGSFFEARRFRRASFADLGEAFAARDPNWASFVGAWTTRPGAPRLELGGVEVWQPPRHAEHGAWHVLVEVRQVQPDDPFPLAVPVAVTVEGRPEAALATCAFRGRTCRVNVHCAGRPVRVDVDPAFDVMRVPDPLEVPPALSTVQGDAQPLFVLPTAASEAEREAWRALAVAWARPGEPRFVLDDEILDLPAAGWVLGASNRLGPALAARLAQEGVTTEGSVLTVAGETFPRADHAWVLVARGPTDPARAVAWISVDDPVAISGLSARLPHYGRYGWLAFRGPAPDNAGKGTWSSATSPLSRTLVAEAVATAPLPLRRALVELPPPLDASRIAEAVAWLADPAREGRSLGSAGLAEATGWVERRLGAIGLEPVGESGFRQTWSAPVGDGPPVTLVNLLGRLPGTDPALAPVLLLAHLDHLGRAPAGSDGAPGALLPGADDNASGVAAMLEIASALAAEPARPRPVWFAVTTAEEVGALGARHLVASLEPAHPVACVNLDTVGRPRDGRLLALDGHSAREWRYALMGAAYTTGVETTLAPTPLGAADHAACLDAGIPAIQFTTGPHGDYHGPGDTADRVDATGEARVLGVPLEIVRWLAERIEPLAFVPAGAPPPSGATGPPPGRTVGVGAMPDFAFPGPGVRIQEVRPGSSGEAAGLRPGDTILAVDGSPVADLRALAAAWRAHRAGDTVAVRIDRGGQILEVRVVLESRDGGAHP